MTATESTWITATTRGRLEHDLAQLSREREAINAQVIEHRRAGDLNNNDAYQRAHAQLDHIDSRATRLRHILSTATATTVNDGTVHPGTVVTVMFDRDPSAVETFLMAVPEEHDTGHLHVCSPHSPLGEALRGARVGDERHYQLPNGRNSSVTVLTCVPHTV